MRERVESHDGVAGVSRGDLFMLVWRSPASLERWEWQMNRIDRVAASRTDMVVFNVILGTSDPPDGALRSRMQADFRKLGEKLRRIVVVPLGGSMWMSVVRTIVRGILLVSGQAQRQSVVGTVSEGLRKLAEVAGPETPSSAEIREMLSAVATELGVQLEEGARDGEGAR